jgi:hypothetical protein
MGRFAQRRAAIAAQRFNQGDIGAEPGLDIQQQKLLRDSRATRLLRRIVADQPALMVRAGAAGGHHRRRHFAAAARPAGSNRSAGWS